MIVYTYIYIIHN